MVVVLRKGGGRQAWSGWWDKLWELGEEGGNEGKNNKINTNTNTNTRKKKKKKRKKEKEKKKKEKKNKLWKRQNLLHSRLPTNPPHNLSKIPPIFLTFPLPKRVRRRILRRKRIKRRRTRRKNRKRRERGERRSPFVKDFGGFLRLEEVFEGLDGSVGVVWLVEENLGREREERGGREGGEERGKEC